MTATVTQEPEAPEVARITQAEDLPDPVRADIIARRQAGETLAELKTRFAHVDPAVLREVLPPANARERKAKEAKVTETQQGTGGRSGKAKSEPKPKAEAKPKAEPRYAEGQEVTDLAERALVARQVVGRGKLAELLDTTQSAVWRAEHGRIHPTEVAALQAGLDAVKQRIAKGEFVKQERQPAAKQPSKADLLHRVEAAVTYLREGTKGLSGKAVAEATLALLDPPTDS